ncbi:MAG: glutathione peroxidase [Actinomycetota bacterium]|nr:glutathione peroxidase [Actinomycetota bacterium]
MSNSATVLDFTATTITGDPQPLDAYAGKVLLIVNVASKCGFTPQYEGLEELWRRYRDDGLVVLGFPCDQFGEQEPGSEAEIADFCSTTHSVSFPMFAKVDVNGDDAHPLYAWLRAEQSGLLGGAIRWNFTKFLVGRDGTVVKRYGSTTKPAKIAGDIDRQLAA